MAIDYASDAFVWRGSGWTAELGVDPYQGSLQSISCPTKSFCAAVDATGMALLFDGSTWSVPLHIDLTGFGLHSVSCPSETFCVAVDASGNAFTYDGTGWGAAVSIDSDFAGLQAVSCSSASFCVAVDGTGNAIVFNGTTWAAPTLVDGQIGGGLSGVSCPSSTFCVAIGYQGDAVTFDGAGWSAVTNISPRPASRRSRARRPPSASRWGTTPEPSPHSTAPAGRPRRGRSRRLELRLRLLRDGGTSVWPPTRPGMPLQFDGTTWAAPVAVDAGGIGLIAVSCAATTFCMALTWAGDAYRGCGVGAAAATGARLGGRSDRGGARPARNVQAGSGPGQPGMADRAVAKQQPGSTRIAERSAVRWTDMWWVLSSSWGSPGRWRRSAR